MVCRIGWRLRTEKKGLRKKDDVWRAEISGFRMHLERFSANGNIFVLRKRPVFSIHAKPLNIRKAFSQHTAATISHRTQTNVQPQISSEKPCCKLAVQQPISEISQSCVSSTAFLSHRFKSSPAIPGKPAILVAAGYMMNAGHFSRNPRIERRFESSPGVQRVATLWGTFGSFRTSEKNKTVPLPEVRGFANLESAHPTNNFAQTQLKPFETLQSLANLVSAHRSRGFMHTN